MLMVENHQKVMSGQSRMQVQAEEMGGAQGTFSQDEKKRKKVDGGVQPSWGKLRTHFIFVKSSP